MPRTIRWGIIGAGSVCEIKSGPAFYQASDSQLAAVMRRDADKARDFAQRHNVPRWYTRAEDLLTDAQVDAVYIATPPAFHAHYAIAALDAGKHVYIEKPVARTAAECNSILAARDRNQRKLCVAHYRRRLPGFLKITEWLRSGLIGKPLLADLELLRNFVPAPGQDHWRLQPALSGGGLFHDLAPHQLDLLLQWFGPANLVRGIARNQQQRYEADDLVAGMVEFACGVVFQGRWHFAAPQRRDHCVIIGSQGRIEFNFFDDQTICLTNEAGSQTHHFPYPAPAQLNLVEAVNDYFRGESDNPSPLEEAQQVMELMDSLTRNSS